MNLKRVTAGLTVTALLLGVAAGTVLAESTGDGRVDSRTRISGSFDDMSGFEWGLSHVTKMNVKGVFRGRGDKLFAPGAKISMQEVAVATVRLMDREAQATVLTEAEVAAALAGIPDQSKIADWARKSVAALVKAGVVSSTRAFEPLSDAKRLDVAIILVKALGYEAEAGAKMGAVLSFKDAHLIPADAVGYVAAAVDHELISGFEDRTFRPDQAVKRVEMAVMMGRADRLVERERRDEFKGTVVSVDAASGTFEAKVGDQKKLFRLAPEASIFVNDTEKSLAFLQAGMKVEVKLNAAGLVIYVEAKAGDTAKETALSGTVTAVVAATPVSLALISLDGVAYPVSPKAVVRVNGQTAAMADVQVGYSVRAVHTLGVIVKLEAVQPQILVTGTITALSAATQSAPAKLTLSVTTGTSTAQTEYTLHPETVVKLDGQLSTVSALRTGDTATLTVGAGVVKKIEATRPVQPGVVIDGTVVALSAAAQTTGALGTVSLGFVQEGSFKLQTFSVKDTTQLTLNTQTATFADLRLNDAVKATLLDNLLVKLEITR